MADFRRLLPANKAMLYQSAVPAVDDAHHVVVIGWRGKGKSHLHCQARFSGLRNPVVQITRCGSTAFRASSDNQNKAFYRFQRHKLSQSGKLYQIISLTAL